MNPNSISSGTSHKRCTYGIGIEEEEKVVAMSAIDGLMRVMEVIDTIINCSMVIYHIHAKYNINEG